MNHEVVHHAIEIPYQSLLTQAFNFAVLIGVLGYVLRDTLRVHFAKRAEDYRALVTKAEAMRAQAESAKRAVEARLAKLDADGARGTGSAQAEGAALREKMIGDAREFARKIEREAEWSSRMIVEKATAGLRRELLDRALATANAALSTGLGSTEQQRLRREFEDKIQVVGR